MASHDIISDSDIERTIGLNIERFNQQLLQVQTQLGDVVSHTYGEII